MIPISTVLSYYKRKDIQEEIVYNARGREVAVRFNDKFGKRPDILQHCGDILELAKQGATSFHASEELWKNPLQLNPAMRKKDLENLREGWDLVLDIDCPYWEISKIITWLMVKALREFGIESVSIKFSGNKGFHIGVPFEAFPEEVNGEKTKNLFPELPRSIASFLLNKISIDEEYTKINEDNSITFGGKFKKSIKELEDITSKRFNEITKNVCSECGGEIKEIRKRGKEFICPRCDSSIKNNDAEFMKCEKCNILMEKIEDKRLCKCGSTRYRSTFNPLSIINVDTLLISSRHLYRMPYSLHEKSGLVSRPFNPDKVLNFEKKFAKPESVAVSKWRFLDKENVKRGEMRRLVNKSLEFLKNKEECLKVPEKMYGDISELPESLFPPCIRIISRGMEDGRKRSLFLLINFLSCVGWGYDKIEKFLRKWNEKNSEELREVYLVGQLRYHKQQKKKILPPNCNNKMYYVDMGVCRPDNLCSKIKNPVTYSVRKGRFLNRKNKQ
jgi:DNA primase large subunit